MKIREFITDRLKSVYMWINNSLNLLNKNLRKALIRDFKEKKKSKIVKNYYQLNNNLESLKILLNDQRKYYRHNTFDEDGLKEILEEFDLDFQDLYSGNFLNDDDRVIYKDGTTKIQFRLLSSNDDIKPRSLIRMAIISPLCYYLISLSKNKIQKFDRFIKKHTNLSLIGLILMLFIYIFANIISS